MTTTYTGLTGYYDSNGVWHSDGGTFVGFGTYGATSTYVDNITGLTSDAQNFNEVAQGYGDIWSDNYNDIMIAGGDKLQTNHHSAIYGDYTVTVDQSAANFAFSFHNTTAGATSDFGDYQGLMSAAGAWGTDTSDLADDQAEVLSAFGSGVTYDGKYVKGDIQAVDMAYVHWVNDLTGSTFSSFADADAAVRAGPVNGVTFTDDTAFETSAHPGDPDHTADTFWHGLTTASSGVEGFAPDHHTQNLALDFNTDLDKVALSMSPTDSSQTVTQAVFDANFHVSSVQESGAWGDSVADSNNDTNQAPEGTQSTLIWMGNELHPEWSVTLLGVHFGDLAGVTASDGDTLANRDAVYADLVGHVAV